MRYRIKLPVDEIVQLHWSEDMPVKKICKKFHVSRIVINRILREAGVGHRNHSEARKVHWKHMTPKERIKEMSKLHDKIRGTHRTIENLEKRAKTRQFTVKLSKLEQTFLDAFQDAGINVVPQYAVSKFNIDFAITNRKIAIEIDGGHWHQSSRKLAQDWQKETFLREEGWTVIRFEANDLGSFVEKLRMHPAFLS